MIISITPRALNKHQVMQPRTGYIRAFKKVTSTLQNTLPIYQQNKEQPFAFSGDVGARDCQTSGTNNTALASHKPHPSGTVCQKH